LSDYELNRKLDKIISILEDVLAIVDDIILELKKINRKIADLAE